MIVLFTDFGVDGPYLGQVQAVLCRQAPGVPVINLFSDLVPFDIQGAAYLLPAYSAGFPPGTVFLCVVDPGVGGSRPACVLQAGACWYVGPDEGLFTLVARRAAHVAWYEIPVADSAAPSFHGRDVFAPVAAQLARDGSVTGRPVHRNAQAWADWPDDLYRVVYIDRYGNAVTGVRAAQLADTARLKVNGRDVKQARTFADVDTGAAFWYANANGLVEIAANRTRADTLLGLQPGTPVTR
jgi:S-adenosylmethionine hydrolase